MATSFDRLKELDLSRDEVHRIGEALKNPEFRQLFADYVEELQDPKNRETFEKEIAELEKERGNDVTFLHPKAGYVLKTSVDGNLKAFINICSNEYVQKPSSSPACVEGSRGLHWSIPHSLSPPREDLDNKQIRCQVYDVMFHPDTLHLASKNKAFRDMVNKTALDAVEKNFEVTLDKKNVKFPKMSYKGMPRSSMVKKPSKNNDNISQTTEEKEFYEKLYASANNNVKPASPKKTKRNTNNTIIESNITSSYTTPKFSIKHRTHLDIQDFTEHKHSKLNATVPKELIIDVNLPLLKCSTDINLDVTEKTLQLTSEKPAKYKLNLTLPYQVNETIGTAKFDKDLKKLVITLPVKRKCEYAREDSGVESDFNGPASPESEENGNSKLVSEIMVASSKIEDIEHSVNTSESAVQFRTFLDDKLEYNLPEFTCHTFENTVAFTLHVKNVDESSISKIFHSNSNMLAVKFASVSSSFYSSHFAFFVKFPISFDENTISIETWDNNVIVQLLLIPTKVAFKSYFVGSNENDMTEKYLDEPSILNEILENNNKTIVDISKPDEIIKNEKTQKEPSKPVEIISKSDPIDIKQTIKQPKPMSYESSGDELSCSSYSPRKSKGILKRRSLLGRSVSESSLDDFVSSSFEANGHKNLDSDIPEDEEASEEVSTSLKKTVRFNSVVKKQLFRCNSSILGQKKKNQRKMKNKKRTQERRHSESEASDAENKKEQEIESDEENGENDQDEHVLMFDSDH